MKKKIKIPLYFGDLVLIQEKSLKKVFKKYNFKELDHKHYDGVCFSHINKKGCSEFVIAFKNETSPGIIAHEVVHVVNDIFEDRCIDLDVENDEAQAYLTGWITTQCYKYLNIKIKPKK